MKMSRSRNAGSSLGMSICVHKAQDSDHRAIADVVTAAFGPAEGPEIV